MSPISGQIMIRVVSMGRVIIIRNGRVLWKVRKISQLFHLHLSLDTQVWKGGIPDFMNMAMAVSKGNHIITIE